MAGTQPIWLKSALLQLSWNGDTWMNRNRSIALVVLLVGVLVSGELWNRQTVAHANVKDTTRQVNSPVVQKEDCYGFEIDKLSVNHQGKNVIRITVMYRYAPGLNTADYMDVNQVRGDVLKTIRQYPNKTDYWEIYSARIADNLIKRYSAQMDSLRLKLEISPTRDEPFARTSLVNRFHPGAAPLIP
jgi:hypothetical protein